MTISIQAREQNFVTTWTKTANATNATATVSKTETDRGTDGPPMHLFITGFAASCQQQAGTTNDEMKVRIYDRDTLIIEQAFQSMAVDANAPGNGSIWHEFSTPIMLGQKPNNAGSEAICQVLGAGTNAIAYVSMWGFSVEP